MIGLLIVIIIILGLCFIGYIKSVKSSNERIINEKVAYRVAKELEYENKEYKKLIDKKESLEDKCYNLSNKVHDLALEETALNIQIQNCKDKLDEQIQLEIEKIEAELSTKRAEKELILEQEISRRELDNEIELVRKVVETSDVWRQFNEDMVASMVTWGTIKEQCDIEVAEFQKQRQVLNEAIQRERKISEKTDYYKIQLTEQEIEDIKALKLISPKMNRRDLIPKLIWDAIVLKATNDMIKRVVGKSVGGIYKVTYIPTGESYIGRTTNFKDRFKNHIGTAVGLDKAAMSYFHTHMALNGIENYTWEILEEVDKDKQSEREKYYIELYNTKQYGLNTKAGG